MAYDETRIPKILYRLGWRRFIISIDLWISLIVSIILTFIVNDLHHTSDVIEILSPILMATSGALIAVSIAGLAIVVSMSDPSFIKILRDKGILSNILLYYWIPAFAASLSIALNALSLVAKTVTSDSVLLSCFLGVSVFLFSYALSSIIQAVGTTVRFGLYRADFLAAGFPARSGAEREENAGDLLQKDSGQK
jgi:hypothetical protein